MTLLADRSNFYNHNIVDNHDFLCDTCLDWVYHYNFLAGVYSHDQEFSDMMSREIRDYRIYDV